MHKQYVVVFDCCGNEVLLGWDNKVGKHGDYCLACDTESPKTTVETRY